MVQIGVSIIKEVDVSQMVKGFVRILRDPVRPEILLDKRDISAIIGATPFHKSDFAPAEVGIPGPD